MKQNPQTSNRDRPIGRGPLLVLALIAGAATLVADPGTSKLSVASRRDRGERQADAQASVTAGSVDANANLELGGGASASAMVTTGQQSGSPRDNEKGGKAGAGSDPGKAPVPEPDTWIALGTLLVIGFSLAVLERRRKRSQPLMGKA